MFSVSLQFAHFSVTRLSRLAKADNAQRPTNAALEDLTLKRHVSDIEAIAEQMVERSARGRDDAYVLPGLERPHEHHHQPSHQTLHGLDRLRRRAADLAKP